MGDAPLGATTWVEAGHRIGRLVRSMLEAEHAFLVVSEPGGRYVQLHAHPGGGCWVEADSGAYSVPLDRTRLDVLRDLGWPVDDEQPPEGNYGFEVEAPVDVYRLVLLLVRTLAGAYRAEPEDLGHLASLCSCQRC